MKLTSLTAALSFAASPIMAADEMTVLLDWFVNPDHGPIIVAQELGYFAEQDLEVEIIAPANPSDPPKLVAAGKAELAISYQPQLHLFLCFANRLSYALFLKDVPSLTSKFE